MKTYFIILFLIIFLCIPVIGFCGHDQGDDPSGADDLLSPDEVSLDILVDQNEDGEAPEKGHVIIKEDEDEDVDEDLGGAPSLGGDKHDFLTIDGGTSDSLFDDVDYEALCWKLYDMSCSDWYFSQLEGAGNGPLTKNGLGRKIKEALEKAGLSPFVPGSSTTPGSDSAADETPGQNGRDPFDTDMFPGLNDTPVNGAGKGGVGANKTWEF